jgi:hypothetical protein
MATKAEIKKAILAVAGNPESGVIFRLADQFAEAVVGLETLLPAKKDARDGETDGLVQDGTSFERPTKETRTTKPEEKR